MQKEKFVNDIIFKMSRTLARNELEILRNVLIDELHGIEFQAEQLPATQDNTNEYYIGMFKQIKGIKLSEKTVAYYEQVIRRLCDTVNKPLTKMDNLDIEYYLRTLQGNSATSINNHLRNISAFFTWMRKQHFVLENPCDSVEPLPTVKKPIEHLNPEEQEMLKSGCKNLRDRAIIEFILSTGCRVKTKVKRGNNVM